MITPEMYREALDEIDRLRAEIAELRSELMRYNGVKPVRGFRQKGDGYIPVTTDEWLADEQ